jgi:CTP:molybdopterin cytidylyltransferase MocA
VLSDATAAVVLAAGRGVRFGGDTPKPLLPLGGQTLLARALSSALASRLAPVLCVVSDAEVEDEVPEQVEVVHNADPARGIASSLQTALTALAGNERIGAVVVGLADQPLVGAEAYRRVADARDDVTPLAVATYGGVRGNPVMIARSLWPDAMALTGDEGARVLIRRYGAREVPCDDTGEPTDIDTPDDLAALEQRWRSQTASE